MCGRIIVKISMHLPFFVVVNTCPLSSWPLLSPWSIYSFDFSAPPHFPDFPLLSLNIEMLVSLRVRCWALSFLCAFSQGNPPWFLWIEDPSRCQIYISTQIFSVPDSHIYFLSRLLYLDASQIPQTDESKMEALTSTPKMTASDRAPQTTHSWAHSKYIKCSLYATECFCYRSWQWTRLNGHTLGGSYFDVHCQHMATSRGWFLRT